MTYSKWDNIQELLWGKKKPNKTCCLAQVLLPKQFQPIWLHTFCFGLKQMVSEGQQNNHNALVTLYGPPGHPGAHLRTMELYPRNIRTHAPPWNCSITYYSAGHPVGFLDTSPVWKGYWDMLRWGSGWVLCYEVRGPDIPLSPFSPAGANRGHRLQREAQCCTLIPRPRSSQLTCKETGLCFPVPHTLGKVWDSLWLRTQAFRIRTRSSLWPNVAMWPKASRSMPIVLSGGFFALHPH